MKKSKYLSKAVMANCLEEIGIIYLTCNYTFNTAHWNQICRILKKKNCTRNRKIIYNFCKRNAEEIRIQIEDKGDIVSETGDDGPMNANGRRGFVLERECTPPKRQRRRPRRYNSDEFLLASYKKVTEKTRATDKTVDGTSAEDIAEDGSENVSFKNDRKNDNKSVLINKVNESNQVDNSRISVQSDGSETESVIIEFMSDSDSDLKYKNIEDDLKREEEENVRVSFGNELRNYTGKPKETDHTFPRRSVQDTVDEYEINLESDSNNEDDFEMAKEDSDERSNTRSENVNNGNASNQEDECRIILERDKNDSESVIIESISDSDSNLEYQMIESERKFSINISPRQWKTIKPSTKYSKKWRRLRGNWSDVLQSSFSEVIPSCVLVFTYNRVKKKSSRKASGNFFTGKARCKFPGCCEYIFSIKKDPCGNDSDVSVKVERKGIIRHQKGVYLKRHLKGKRRKKIAKALEKKGAGNFHYETLAGMKENAIDAGNITECTTPEILYQVSKEMKKKDVIHEDYLIEVRLVRDTIKDLDDESLKISGYVQHISVVPFIVIMFSEKQLILWKEEMQYGNDVLYLDATGSVVQKLKDQDKDVYYYAMVLRNMTSNQPALPVAEMISADHTSPTLSFFLMKLRHAYTLLNSKPPQPARVETDFSWALIHSVLQVFNQENIHIYLQRAWQLLNGETQSVEFTVIHLCAWHMFRNVSKEINIKARDKELSNFIKYCFSLLQNSSNLAEAGILFRDIVRVLGSRSNTNDVECSLDSLRLRISKLPAKIDSDNTKVPLCNSDKTNEDQLDLFTQQRGSIKENSPFTRFFSEIQTANSSDDDGECITNDYFCQEGINCLNKYLPLFPLWSGVLLGDLKRHFAIENKSPAELTRDTQCMVENWMNILKNSILLKERRIRPGQLVKRLHINIKGRVRKFRMTRPLKRKAATVKKKKTLVELAEEKWMYGKKGKKGSFYNSPHKFPIPKSKITLTKKTQKSKSKSQESSNLQGESARNVNTHSQDTKISKSEIDKTKKQKTSVLQHPAKPSNVECSILNENNNCWLNSTLQALKQIQTRFHIYNAKGEIRSPDNFITLLLNKLVMLTNISNDPLEVDDLLEALQQTKDEFRNYQIGLQHDAAMLINYILSGLMEMNSIPRLCIRYLQKCLLCNRERITGVDTLHVLPLEISSDSYPSIQTCIDAFYRVETLTGEESVECRTCGSFTPLERRTINIQEPDFLVIQLKRFDVCLSKITTRVFINRDISLKNHLNDTEENIYSLRAVQLHWGTSIECGHYTTAAISTESQVISYDDTRVKINSENYLCSAAAEKTGYIFYYEKTENRKSNMVQETQESEESVIVSIAGKIDITVTDMNTLKQTNWLNDKIVNGFLTLLAKSEKVYCMDSFWLETIERHGNKKFKRIYDLESYRYVFLPIHSPCHWSLLVIDVQNRCFSFLDPLGTLDERIHNIMKFFMKAHSLPLEHNVKLEKQASRQETSGDCGVYILEYARCIAQGTFPFNQKYMEHARERIREDIMRGTLNIKEKRQV